jgi:hypothetical protein
MAGILAVLIVMSIVIPRIAYRSNTKKPCAGIPSEQIARIKLFSNGQTILFEKDADIWRVTCASSVYTADAEAVQTILDSAQALEIKEVVSSNPERQDRFEVSPAKGTRIQLFMRGKETPGVDFYLGKALPDYMHFYLRFEGSNSIHSSLGFSSYIVKKQPDGWRNRKLGSPDKKLIESIAIEQKSVIDTVKKENGSWYYNAKQLDEATVAPLIDRVSPFMASDVVPSADEPAIMNDITAARQSDMKLTILSAGGTDTNLVLDFFPYRPQKAKDPEKYYVTKSNENGVFIVNPGILGLIRDDLKRVQEASAKPAAPPPAPAPAAAPAGSADPAMPQTTK